MMHTKPKWDSYLKNVGELYFEHNYSWNYVRGHGQQGHSDPKQYATRYLYKMHPHTNLFGILPHIM